MFFHKDQSLIEMANQLAEGENCPLPLRRTFSILRQFGFETGCIELIKCEKQYDNGNIELSCPRKGCGKRYESCKDYIIILEKYYDCVVESKKCYKISFFDSKIDNEQMIDKLPNSSLLAYCILHIDNYKKNGKNRKLIYVTESTIATREKRKTLYLAGNHISYVNIAKRKFEIRGHYFSQQNHITNCCAQASIKMAFKGYYDNLTAEEINRVAGIDHIKKKGNRGLEPIEFKKTIENIYDLNVEIVDALTLGPWEFIKYIYHAIESRFPVILLFSHPNGKNKKNRNRKYDGHATALIGHTFSNNNWWGYGWSSYFNSIKQPINYLPSVLWCDKFVIQDDNLGPYYRMPITSLKVTGLSSKFPPEAKKIIRAVKKNILSHVFPSMYWPTYAIISYPKKSVDFGKCLEIENFSLEQLYEYIEKKLSGTELEPIKNNQYRELFLYFYKIGQLIARTFAVKKCEYIDYFIETYRNEDMEDIEAMLKLCISTEYIWLTEISVPELFWVNKKKICDIICEPTASGDNNGQIVKYIRVPSHHCFFLKNHTIERQTFSEKDSRYPLLSVGCSSCFS